MKPLVTLVTPVYNAMPYFEKYLECVMNQSWRPLEFIIVDDGSTDGSWEYLQKKVSALREEGIPVKMLRRIHEGQAAAVNAALPFITGEYFTWCDADDWMTPDSIEKKAEFLMAHGEMDMVRSDGFYIDGESGRVFSHSAREKDCFTQNIFHELFWGTTYCYAGCYMIRTSLLFACYPQKSIPLSPEGQNLQLLLPPASRTECGFLPEVLHYYYQRRSGHSGRERSFRESLRRIENFSSLRLALLPYCACDREYYSRQDKEVLMRDKRQLYGAVAARARKDRKK